MNLNTRDGLEHDIKRRAHKLTIRATNGEMQGPELESAILALIWRALEQNQKRGNPLGVDDAPSETCVGCGKTLPYGEGAIHFDDRDDTLCGVCAGALEASDVA